MPHRRYPAKLQNNDLLLKRKVENKLDTLDGCTRCNSSNKYFISYKLNCKFGITVIAILLWYTLEKTATLPPRKHALRKLSRPIACPNGKYSNCTCGGTLGII